jgi:undecaprenyl-diphosphatase
MTGRRRLAASGAGLAIGLAGVTATGALARRRGVHPAERRAFRRVNDLPDSVLPPVFVVMQAGSLGADFAFAAVAYCAGRHRLASTMALTGTSVWAVCKGVKRWVGRGRPQELLETVNVRGPAERGLGFPSGHAAVAVTLAGLAAPEVPPRVRPLLWGAAAAVAAARVYVGAHLPLDVVGGAGIGLAAASAVRLRAGDPARD